MDRRIGLILIVIIILLLYSLPSNAEDFFYYQIEKGDTLSLIANNFKVDINNIIKNNNITNPNLILVGQKIKIPLKVNTYTVQKGDSLWEIAKTHDIELKELIKINNINSPGKIYIGQKLTIPNNEERTRYKLASRSQRNSFIWPVNGKISSEYGWRLHPIRNQREFHTGLDIAAPYGTPVHAAKDGTVVYSGWADGYGMLVIIKHQDNSLTYYGHNISLLVREGVKVRQGKIIALVGDTGVATGPHLHFEIRINGKHTNPIQYLNQRYMVNGFRI